MTATLAFSKGSFPNPMTTLGDMIKGGTSGVATRVAVGTIGQRIGSSGTDLSWVNDLFDITFVIDGGGVVLTTGLKGFLQVNQALTIVSNSMFADQAGSVVVDLWKCTFAQFDAGATHPVAGDKITAAAPPTIAAATKSTDATLTGWTLALAAGDILGYNVNSVATITRVTVDLKCKKAA